MKKKELAVCFVCKKKHAVKKMKSIGREKVVCPSCLDRPGVREAVQAAQGDSNV